MKKYHFLGPIFLLIVWFIVARLGLIDSFLLPGPIATIEKLVELTITGVILNDLSATLYRVLVSFGIAAILGVPIGLLLGSSRKIYHSIEFVIDFFRSTPSTALFPLFILIFGVSDLSKIAVAAFAAILIIIFNTAYGVMHATKSRVLASEVMGASKVQIFRTVLFWESLPQTFVGLKNGISLALVIIIVAEMFIGGSNGLGGKIIDAQTTYEIPTMYATILLAGIVGYGLNFFFNFFENKFLHWSGE